MSVAPQRVMWVAGELSGDRLGAELLEALHARFSQPIRHFGMGGPALAAAGMELLEDVTSQAVIGHLEAIKKYRFFRGVLRRLVDYAEAHRPDLVVLVDFSGFNRPLAAALRKRARRRSSRGWDPKIVYFVSPQVWASRPGRARTLERDLDLLLSIFPFEQDWYAQRHPALDVRFVGHPIVDRYAGSRVSTRHRTEGGSSKRLVLLPGSRVGEVHRHLPVMLKTLQLLRKNQFWTAVLAMPNESLASMGLAMVESHGLQNCLDIEIGNLPEALAGADFALACSGTVTLECAWFELPTVVMYKTHPLVFLIGKSIVSVPFLAMPNLLAGHELFPERLQSEAIPEKLAEPLREWAANPVQAQEICEELRQIKASLGDPGAVHRASEAIEDLFRSQTNS